jgi:hypothetical protein
MSDSGLPGPVAREARFRLQCERRVVDGPFLGGTTVSGPLEEVNEVTPGLGISAIEVREGRSTTVGRIGVVRVLPTKGRRTAGPWCFVDLIHPGDIAEPPRSRSGPIPRP